MTAKTLRGVAVLASTALVAAGIGTSSSAAALPSSAAPTAATARVVGAQDEAPPIQRFSGANRYATAAQISANFAPGVQVAYVATGENYPDALAGAARAGAQDGPVLLTRPGSVPGPTATELSRLKPKRIVVLGGEGAVSKQVADHLEEYATADTADEVTRVHGTDRYRTAAKISAGHQPGVEVVYVATGQNYPDALAGAARAGAQDGPVLLTRPGSLPGATKAELGRLQPSHIAVLGGQEAISDTVMQQLEQYVPGGGDDTPATGDFPDETTTGVPAGTTLQKSGSLTINEDGTVIDGLEITGTVVVNADDVVIRNTLIKNTGNIPVRSNGDNLVIEDSEIDGRGKGVPAIAYNDYTLRRVNIHSVGEGPRIAGGDVVIEDSYIHHLVQVGNNHTDVIQAVSGDNIVLRGNNLQSYNPDSGRPGNAVFQFGEEDGPVEDCTVEDNLMNGGNYTVNGGGGGTSGADCDFAGNVFQRDFRYGTHGNLGPNVDWDDSNVWFDTGDPV